MYPSAKAIARPEVKAFMEFVVANQADIAKAAKIVPLTDEQATKAKADLKTAEADVALTRSEPDLGDGCGRPGAVGSGPAWSGPPRRARARERDQGRARSPPRSCRSSRRC